MKHANSFVDYTTDELKGILLLAEKIKQHPDDYSHILDGKKLYTLFEKTSNRTYLSFSIGMEELGGKAYKQLMYRHLGSEGLLRFPSFYCPVPLILTASSPWFPARNVLHHSNDGGWQYQQ